jgi:hypothetical protein
VDGETSDTGVETAESSERAEGPKSAAQVEIKSATPDP